MKIIQKDPTSNLKTEVITSKPDKSKFTRWHKIKDGTMALGPETDSPDYPAWLKRVNKQAAGQPLIMTKLSRNIIQE
jgi:hypothetical protein